MISSQPQDRRNRANGWTKGKPQARDYQYNSNPRSIYSSHDTSRWHSRGGSSHATSEDARSHARQESTESQELEFDPNFDPTRSSMVDGMLQTLNDIPDASGPSPALEPIQTDFPDGEFRPTTSAWDWKRIRARSSRGTSFSSNTQIGQSIDETSPPRSRRPFFHRRRHTASSSQNTVDLTPPNLTDADRRELARTKQQTEKLAQVRSQDTGVPRSRMKHRDTDGMDHARNRLPRDDSPSDFDLNPQDHHRTRRRSQSYSNAPVLNRSRPVPAEYHVFDDDTLRRAEAQRHALRQSTSFSNNAPERQENAAKGLIEPPMMPGARHGSSRGSLGGDADSASLSRGAGTRSANDDGAQSLRVPHSQSFTGASSLRSQNDLGGGKDRSRAGFLRRMFTSSSKTSLSSADMKQQVPQLPPFEAQAKKEERRSQALQEHQAAKVPGTSAKAPTQGESEKQTPQRPQQLRSKRSFFQRRRKTLTEQDIPDMPLEPPPAPQGNEQNHQSNRPSTSSLRQVMNPWITQASPRKPRNPDDVDLESLDDEAPRRRKPDNEDVYEFLRSTAPPGYVGPSKPGTQLPPRGAQESKDSAIPPEAHRRRPSVSARDPKDLDDADMQTTTTLAPAVTEAATKAIRRRSATSPAVRSPDDSAKTVEPSPVPVLSVPSIETSPPRHDQNSHAQTAPPESTSKSQDLAPSPPASPGHDPSSKARTWIAPDESSDDEEVPVSARLSKPYVEPAAYPVSPPLDKDASAEFSPTQEDFTSAKSVHVDQLDPSEPNDEDISPLSTGEDKQLPLAIVPDALPPVPSNEERARRIFEAEGDPQAREQGALELGEPGANAEKLRSAFMSFFDFAGLNILLALRDLCARTTLKGETQQMDRIMSAFSRRWCECNSNHGFRSEDVVHTICYSLLLLNTDLHVADLTDKMTRNQFVKNTIPTLRRIAEADTQSTDATLKIKTEPKHGLIPFAEDRPLSPTDTDMRLSADDRRNTASRMSNKHSLRPTSEIPSLASPSPYETHPMDASSLLVDSAHEGNMKGWETALETVLKEYYLSIRQLKLPLYGAEEAQMYEQPANNSLSVMTNLMRRTGSVISKTPSDDARGRASTFRSAASRFANKNRSRPRLYPTSTLGSSRTASRTSLEDNNFWSPTASSFNSGSRTLTTYSTDSLHSKFAPSEMGYQQSIGFANALSHVIIREEGSSILDHDGEGDGPLLDDESLELAGAPWAKEGILQHKHHLESEGKRARDRNWSECFAVIQRGTMRLFSFSGKSSTRSQKKAPQKAGGVVGGGNWMENAEALASFTLRHTIANALPPPGYSKQRPHVFALSLPTGAVHLFHVGTAEIAQEFVMTANYWSARLSKEPLVGGVSNVEYGWGESVINSALLGSSSVSDANNNAANKANPNQPPSSFHLPRAESSLSTATPTGRTSSSGNRSLHSPTPSASFSLQSPTGQGERNNSSHRPSISGSLRSSFEAPRPAAFRNRLPADRLVLGSWQPPQQSLMPSRLPEVEQLAALKAYVSSVEEDLARHNELRPGLVLAFTPRSVNAGRAMGNWERKSHYLLREIVKFRTYVDVLEAAEQRRGEVGKEEDERKEERERGKEAKKGAVKVVQSEEDFEISEETREVLRGMRGVEGFERLEKEKEGSR